MRLERYDDKIFVKCTFKTCMRVACFHYSEIRVRCLMKYYSKAESTFSKFAIFLEYKNPSSVMYFVLLPNESPVLYRHRGKIKVARNAKMELHATSVFVYQ